ncbi:hypothetical protein LP109_07925 [Moraxella bovis]|uniref:Uncharacterized protein n=1 Tax=Moraxella lacunata TaxID=477 RepID=A0A1V4GUR9_MORLA|nr:MULTISPECIES: hypothetical protein [Moraxella]OPH36395.1 hypothetical protein B5J94_07325 [Moraxella lacunata]UZA13282.1 hypothetical protein LP102_07525 [Moraxella bovis]UZA15597.1 hypothetical protein LP109_07925 [Moraxella bovis]
MSEFKATDTCEFITDLTAGAFAEQIGVAISDVCSQVVATGKKGQIKLTFDLSPIGEKGMGQIQVKHKLDYTAPETFGTRKEDYARETSMYCHTDGRVSLFYENQLFGHEA